ncbi:MAG: AAA family ATPase [Pseudomonadota bacterium]
MAVPCRIVSTTCSGGGTSTLLAEMARHGWAVAKEAGRAVLRVERAAGDMELPWPEIFVTDRERRHGLAELAAKCQALEARHCAASYGRALLPKAPAAARAGHLEQAQSGGGAA